MIKKIGGEPPRIPPVKPVRETGSSAGHKEGDQPTPPEKREKKITTKKFYVQDPISAYGHDGKSKMIWVSLTEDEAKKRKLNWDDGK